MIRTLLAGLTLALLIASPVIAAKPASCAAVTVSPEPSVAGEVATVTATCLPVGHHVTFSIGGVYTSTFASTDTVSFDWPYFGTAGSYRVAVYDSERRFLLLAETTHTVAP